MDIGGQVHKEPMTRETFEAHWAKTGRFSKIVWVDDWEEFKKIRYGEWLEARFLFLLLRVNLAITTLS